MKINHNISALNSIRSLDQRSIDLDRNIMQLSSGERINSAGDDALDFAISEKMRTMISGLQSASKNAESAISFIQTTEGYLMGAQDIMRRIKELAVQAANGIYSSQDRALAEKEVAQLVAEVDRISSFASFNGVRMLQGQYARSSAENIPTASLLFHLGPEIDQNVRAYIATFNASSLGLNEISISSPIKANQTIATVEEALTKINSQRTDLGAYKNRLEIAHRTINITADNFIKAESKVRDTDVATTAVDLAKNMLVNQANIAALTQANTQAQSVLRLLG